MRYNEIKELYSFCLDNGIVCTFEPFIDGYAIIFNNGADVTQHKGSYGHGSGCVEFGYTYKEIDFTAVTLDEAKQFILENKEELNRDKI